MAVARFGQTATLLADGRVLIAGGSDPDTAGGGLHSAELYDPTSGIFSPAGSMHVGHWENSALLLLDGHVLIFGDGDAELYEP